MWTIIIIAIVIVILIAAVPKNKETDSQHTPKPKPALRMLDREGDPDEDEWFTYIAGVPHHATKYQIGGFCGWVAHEEGNKYDPYAMGVYNSKGKLLGYIPAKDVKQYRAWCDAEPQPCVGFIYEEDGQLRGRVKVLRPCNAEFLQTEFQRFVNWINNNYGRAYVPDLSGIQFETT